MFSEKDYVDALKFCKEHNYPLDNVGVVTEMRHDTRNTRLENEIKLVQLSTFQPLYRAHEKEYLRNYTRIGDLVLFSIEHGPYGDSYTIVQNIRYEMMLENLKRAKNKIFGNIVENQQQK